MKAVTLLAALALASCSAPGSSSFTAGSPVLADGTRGTSDILGGPPTKQIKISLFDAPPALNGVAVNVAIEGVQLMNGILATPFVTYVPEQVENLVSLQDHSLDFNAKAPIGSYTGVRMLIDATNSNVTIAGRKIPIIWGAPGQVNLSPVVAVDFAVPFAVGNTGDTKLALDFNVLQSVRFQNGVIYVQPSTTAANSPGSISGTVNNNAGKPVSGAAIVLTDAGGKTVNVTSTGSDGKFQIHAVAPGSYTVTVQNSYTTKSGTVLTASGNDAGAASSTPITVAPQDNVQLDKLVD